MATGYTEYENRSGAFPAAVCDLSEWQATTARGTEIEAAPANSNDGVILTSTLWDQSGTVYVSCNGEQTPLTGWTYNRYCPNESPSSSKRSITGCTNTADAQIIYYWIERGFDFSLSVSSSNYFYLSGKQIHYLSDTSPAAGEATISTLNSALAAAEKIGNGQFIAALNFFCGVNNHSTYASDSTSTTWYHGIYTDGTNNAAFEAAGFDSFYFIHAETANSLFSDGKINEVGYSILRENFDYGEAVRIGIPGHSIYMDGYHYDQANGQYEYHLNYGWGIDNNATGWYTVSELNGLNIKYMTVDLSPDIFVTVTNSRGDYYGGSFLRGVERINHIVNDKRTTFSFADEIAGKTISLSTTANFTAAVDLDFDNFNATLSTTAAGLISSNRAMNFSLSGGAMVVNRSGSGNYAVRENGNRELAITLDKSFIYTGYQSGGVSAIRNALSAGTISSAFYASVSGYAVKSGAAADTLTLANRSAVFGDLDLGGGQNELSIDSGSLFYGSFTGSADTLSVNLSITSSQFTDAMIVLADTASAAPLYAATGGVIHLDFSSACRSYTSTTYDLFHAGTQAAAKQYSIELTAGNQQVTLDAENPTATSFSLAYDDDGMLSLCYVAAPRISASTTAPTNQSVTLTATADGDAVTKQYSTDGKNWENYSQAVIADENGVWYFRALGANGVSSEVVSYQVNNIDRTPPAAPTVTASTAAPTNQSVTLTATFSGDTVAKEYSADGKNWKSYTAAVAADANGTWYFRGTDAAGNLSGVTTYRVSNIDKTPPAAPTVKVSTIAPTNHDVTMTATFSGDTAAKQYSADGKNWKSYTAAVAAGANGTWYFRGIDAAGNVSEVASFRISNIDKTPPAAPTVKASTTALVMGSVSLTAAFSGDTVAKQYSTDGRNWKSYTAAVVANANGTWYFRGIDAAGNASGITTYRVSNICDRVSAGMPVSGGIGRNGNYVNSIDMGLECAGNYRISGNFGQLKGTIAIVRNGKKVASGKISNGILTFNRNKPVLLTGGNDYQIVVTNTDKGKSASDYSFEVVADRLFDKGDNHDDSWQTAENLSTVKKTGTLVANGWVGYGDVEDWQKITLANAANLNFSVTADGAVKFTVCQLDGSRLKPLQKLTVKSKGSTATATSKKGVLVAAGTYYLCTTSTDAAKGGAANYSIALNSSSVFFPAGDNSNDTWQAAAGKAKSGIGSTLKGWVGYGDATDFHGIVSESGQLAVNLDAMTAEAFRKKKLKLSLVDGSGRKVAMAAFDNDTFVTKKEVDAGVYYLGISCANVKKYDSSYSVTLGMLA